MIWGGKSYSPCKHGQRHIPVSILVKCLGRVYHCGRARWLPSPSRWGGREQHDCPPTCFFCESTCKERFPLNVGRMVASPSSVAPCGSDQQKRGWALNVSNLTVAGCAPAQTLSCSVTANRSEGASVLLCVPCLRVCVLARIARTRQNVARPFQQPRSEGSQRRGELGLKQGFFQCELNTDHIRLKACQPELVVVSSTYQGSRGPSGQSLGWRRSFAWHVDIAQIDITQVDIALIDVAQIDITHLDQPWLC